MFIRRSICDDSLVPERGAFTVASTPYDVEQTTAFALAEKGKLIKSLRRFDMVFFTICAFVGLDTLGTVAQNGPAGIPLARRPGGRLRRSVHAR